MRKLKLQMQMTVDGYVARPNGELDWATHDWDGELEEYTEDLTEPVDTIVLGRKLAEGFIPHWAAVAENPDAPEHEAGKLFTRLPKVVFTRTLDESKWDDTVLATGELADEIMQLKQPDGGDIIAYGGATFVSNLIEQQLIDELHLFVNPVAIGEGMAIFTNGVDEHMTLRDARPFECGIVVLHYVVTDTDSKSITRSNQKDS